MSQFCAHLSYVSINVVLSLVVAQYIMGIFISSLMPKLNVMLYLPGMKQHCGEPGLWFLYSFDGVFVISIFFSVFPSPYVQYPAPDLTMTDFLSSLNSVSYFLSWMFSSFVLMLTAASMSIFIFLFFVVLFFRVIMEIADGWLSGAKTVSVMSRSSAAK